MPHICVQEQSDRVSSQLVVTNILRRQYQKAHTYSLTNMIVQALLIVKIYKKARLFRTLGLQTFVTRETLFVVGLFFFTPVPRILQEICIPAHDSTPLLIYRPIFHSSQVRVYLQGSIPVLGLASCW